MSRRIDPKASVTITEEEAALRKTGRSRLLFTSYQGRNCALLIQNNRLLEASFFPKEPSKVGSVYIGKVKSMVKNIDACFVEIADGEICFLPLKCAEDAYLLNRKYDGRILEGDEFPVQITKDAQKAKRASVTARISLANEYFVIGMGSTKVNYSSKLDKKQRGRLERLLEEMSILDPCKKGHLIQAYTALLSAGDQEKLKSEGLRLDTFKLPDTSLIVRTRAEEESMGEEHSAEELRKQFYDLSVQYIRLLYISMYRNCFSCLRTAETEIEKVLQKFSAELKDSEEPLGGADPEASEAVEIITDQEEIYEQLQDYSERYGLRKCIRLYQDSHLSLAALYSVERKIRDALDNRVWLKSGGYLVIEPTEALTVIDVNSGKYEAGKNAQDTYRRINQEAAEEVAVQLRLRNLSGIIVVDFINMCSPSDNAALLSTLRSLVKKDKVRTTVVDMTPLGLVEITRMKINRPLWEQFNE